MIGGRGDRGPAADASLVTVWSDVDAMVVDFVAANRVPGASVGIVVDQRSAWSTSVGVTDQDRMGRPDDATLYRIASITKTFTASAIVQLRDEGRLGLDDPLVWHLPEFAAVRNPFGPIEQVTLRRILRHSSGLQVEAPSPDPRQAAHLTLAETLAALDHAVIAIPPDTVYKYSNLGFDLLGAVICRIAGREDYGDTLDARILRPLGMTATSLDPPPEFVDRRARGYDAALSRTSFRAARILGPGSGEGSGGLWSSVDDLTRWLAQQFRAGETYRRGPGQVLDGTSLAEMHRAAFVADADLTAAQGLGWKISRQAETVLIGHGGLLNGFNTRIDFSPVDRVGAIVLFNGIGIPRSAADLSRSLLELMLPAVRSGPRQEAAREEASAVIPAAWSELVGAYVDIPFGERVRIEIRDGSLVLVNEDDGMIQALLPTDDPARFRFTAGRRAGEDLLFLCDSRGAIDGLNAAGDPMTRSGLGAADDGRA